MKYYIITYSKNKGSRRYIRRDSANRIMGYTSKRDAQNARMKFRQYYNVKNCRIKELIV